MVKLIKPFTSLWRLYKKTRSWRLAYYLLPWSSTALVTEEIRYKNKKVFFLNNSKIYSKEVLALFNKNGDSLVKFLNAGNIEFEKGHEGEYRVCISLNNQRVKLHVYNYENLKVIEEIFIDQLYDIHSNHNYVVMDVGMNIGAASLYFASLQNVEKVYSYEPFYDTFALAQQNALLNEHIGAKIEMFNYGIGASDETLKVPKPSYGFLGGSTSDFVIRTLNADSRIEEVNVEIKSITERLENIKTDHPDRKIILKLDCEGAEYEIIDDLKNKGMIGNVDIYMIEYHFKGKGPILETLKSNNFLVMAPGSEEASFYGMLYAVKSN